MIIKSNFKPAWWLSNPHLQTSWATLARRRENIPLQRERIELPDGDFIDVDWALPQTKVKTPIVMVLHGLGGSIDSHYARALLKLLVAENWRGAFMHFRGASGMPNRLARNYHSGDTEDVAYLARLIREREPNVKLLGVGYSLGGNVLLKWLGETKTENPLFGAVAISVPFKLANAAGRINQGFSKIYQWILLRQMRSLILTKSKIVKTPINLENLIKARTFLDFDTHVTAPLHGFKDANDYYRQASSQSYLRHIAKPTLIIHAKDDPFMTPACIPTLEELSSQVTFEISDYGGHVGFISGQIPGRPEYWAEKRIIEYLSNLLDLGPPLTLDERFAVVD